MNKKETKEKIIAAIRENFTVTNEDFVTDEEYGFIEQSIENSGGHEAFNEKLSGILNKIFPDHKNSIEVDTCDTIEDILHNNFNFD